MKIPYGNGALEAPEIAGLRVLLPNAAPPARAEIETLRAALEAPIDRPPLRELARGRGDAVILISCRTRRTGSALFIPLILDALNEGGIADGRILVLAATGTHDNWRDADRPLLLGAAADRVRVVGHDAHTADGLADIGTTSFGNRVRLNRRYLDAGLKIATGRVTHHYFAGFTAGPKAVLPGVAAFDTIVTNHRRTLIVDGDTVRLHPHTNNGCLDKNPVHLEMIEAARMAPPDFSLLTVLNTQNEVTAAFGGETLAAHARAVAMVREADAPRLDAPADIVLLSSGGAPLDVNFVQAMKALMNCEAAVRPGGAIVLAAECAEGAAPWLMEGVAMRDPAEFARRAASGEMRHAHNAIRLDALRRRAHVVMVTQLAPAIVDTLGFHRAGTIGEALALARRLAGGEGDAKTSGVGAAARSTARTLALPYGNITFIRDSEAAARDTGGALAHASTTEPHAI
ncbi:MAG: nickel-dependent lactate racemase [bacterium]